MAIYHELFGQHLRLGNFLFKFAWSVVMKHKIRVNTIYPDYYLWKYLQNPPAVAHIPELFEESMLRPTKWEWSEYEESMVEEFILTGKDTTVALNFFFQSEKWFKNYRDEVYKSLQFKQEEIDRVKEKYAYLFNSTKYCPTIGIGIRLGDFVGHGDFYQIPHDWYIKALDEHFPYWEERKVVVFSDDIEQAKRIFGKFPFYYAYANGTETHADNFKHYHGDASEHLILGSLMDDFIIGNSTFSWWQAWLSSYNKPLSRVIHSGKVFSETGNMKDIDTTFYYPDWWTKFEI